MHDPNRKFPAAVARLGYGCTLPLTSGIDVRGGRNAPRPPGDTTDPALGGYPYGQAAYPGGSSSDGSGYAVATAGGFTYRANESKVYLRRAGASSEEVLSLDNPVPVLPGDNIRVPERYF